MQPTELRMELEKLRVELARTPEVDASKREELQNLIAEIEQVVEESRSLKPLDDSRGASLNQRLEAAIEEFEIRHPQLTAILSQLVDRLSEIGI